MQNNTSDGSGCVTAAVVEAFATTPVRAPPGSNEESPHYLMMVYLDKLKELVPHCPKNRNVSKLELIQHVIDYINDLQDTLQRGEDDESPPPSPVTGDPINFTDAFSHLNFEENPQQGLKFLGLQGDLGLSSTLCLQGDLGLSSTLGSRAMPPAVYTSDGASDYDSRGSSPVGHHSDLDCSSDEFTPFDSKAAPPSGSFYGHPHLPEATPSCNSYMDPNLRLLLKPPPEIPYYHFNYTIG